MRTAITHRLSSLLTMEYWITMWTITSLNRLPLLPPAFHRTTKIRTSVRFRTTRAIERIWLTHCRTAAVEAATYPNQTNYQSPCPALRRTRKTQATLSPSRAFCSMTRKTWTTMNRLRLLKLHHKIQRHHSPAKSCKCSRASGKPEAPQKNN